MAVLLGQSSQPVFCVRCRQGVRTQCWQSWFIPKMYPPPLDNPFILMWTVLMQTFSLTLYQFYKSYILKWLWCIVWQMEVCSWCTQIGWCSHLSGKVCAMTSMQVINLNWVPNVMNMYLVINIQCVASSIEDWHWHWRSAHQNLAITPPMNDRNIKQSEGKEQLCQLLTCSKTRSHR